MKRKFTAATQDKRCEATVTLRDGSKAQCMRAAKVNGKCLQHDRIANERRMIC